MIDKKIKTLNFSTNWNNKLNNKAFTTLRLSNRFCVGDKIEITLKDKKICNVEIIDKACFTLDKINNYISYLDTGYSPDECKNILKKMYKNFDWGMQKIYFYLMVKK
jgi:hypothetical protein